MIDLSLSIRLIIIKITLELYSFLSWIFLLNCSTHYAAFYLQLRDYRSYRQGIQLEYIVFLLLNFRQLGSSMLAARGSLDFRSEFEDLS